MKKIIIALFLVGATIQYKAQTAEEIIASYYDAIGGKEKLAELKGIKMSAKINQMGMEIPLNIVRMKDGKQMVSIEIQGKTIKQGVFDGEVLWNTNFMTQKAEKSTKEDTENFKKQSTDFPDAFYNYKEKGYAIELIGKEDFDGAECYKIKLTQTPLMVEGKEVENFTYYYFDTETNILVGFHAEIKEGQMKGKISETKVSDYQEVDGIYFPFSLTQGEKDGMSQTINIDKIELNPEVDNSEFAFPEEDTETEEKESQEEEN